MNNAIVKPRGFTSVMANRQPTPPDGLDYFPTPPWATRAVLQILRAHSPSNPRSARDPCCGEGHMAEVLREDFPIVWASDVFDYGYGDIEDYLDARTQPLCADWLVFNPPFKAAQAFVERGLIEAGMGVAALLRLGWADTTNRYWDLFSQRPPAAIYQFAERVPMHQGEWKPDGDTATAYAWWIWTIDPDTGLSATPPGETRFRWIAPGQRQALTKPDDARRFARLADAPLLDHDRQEKPQ